MLSHTPGPWTVGKPVTSCGLIVYIPIMEGKNHLASTSVYKKKPDGSTAGRKYIDKYGTERNARTVAEDECEANAHLIAAAPELLEALEKAVYMIADYRRTPEAAVDVLAMWSQVEMRARAAIRKAKGETC